MNLLMFGFCTRGFTECAALSHNAGYSVLALDYFGDMDQGRWGKSYSLSRDFKVSGFNAEGLIETLCKMEENGVNYEAVVYTSGIENQPEVIRHVANRKRLLGNPAPVVEAARDFKRVHHLLQKAGVSCPRTLYHWRSPPPTGEWLCKPLDSGGGSKIIRASHDEPVPANYMLQEFCQGRPASVAFVANGTDARILGLSEQLCGLEQFGAKPFLYRGNIAPLDFSSESSSGAAREQTLQKVRKMVSIITKECGLVGVNGIDFLLTDELDVLFLEVNPRYSSSMELYRKVYGLDIFRLHVESFEGRLPERHLLREENPSYSGPYWGKAIVYAPWDLVTKDTRTWFTKGIRDIPYPNEEIPAGAPICTVFAEGESGSRCLDALEEKQDWVLRHVSPVV